MKRASNLLQAMLGLALLGGLSIAVVFAFQTASRNNPALNLSVTTTCVPTPVLWATDVGTATNTPAPFQLTPSQIATLPFYPSATPWPISKITDLSPDVPTDHKGQVTVFHCDGSFELFLTAGTQVPLLPGDMVIRSIAAEALVGHQPPEATGFTPPLLSTPTPVTPYVSRTPFPYPPYPIPITPLATSAPSPR